METKILIEMRQSAVISVHANQRDLTIAIVDYDEKDSSGNPVVRILHPDLIEENPFGRANNLK